MRVDEATLRTISELITRQTLAIETLTQRLEATERRLEQTMLPTVELSRDIPGPFCAIGASTGRRYSPKWGDDVTRQ